MLETKTEGTRNLAFLLSEAVGTRSRDVVTIASGAGVIEAGTVLGEITASGEYVPAPNAVVVGQEGAETATAILAYKVDATDAAVPGVAIRRDAEAKRPMLIFHSSVDDDTKKAAKITDLAAVHIIAR